jgi:hypothetical protein
MVEGFFMGNLRGLNHGRRALVRRNPGWAGRKCGGKLPLPQVFRGLALVFSLKMINKKQE